MWLRSIVVVALFSASCGGQPPPSPEPAPPPPVEDPAPVADEPSPEPEPTPVSDPVEEPEPAAPAPKPEPPSAPKCADLGQSRCEVTEGCEWHSVKKCLEQEKPKTLDD